MIISTATASVASMLEGPNHALILHAAKGMFIQNVPVTDDEGKQLVRLEPWTQ